MVYNMKLSVADKIKYHLVHFLLKSLAFLPLRYIESLGNIIGILMLRFSKRSTVRLKNNLLQTKMCNDSTIEDFSRATSKHLGQVFIETLCLSWHRSKRFNFNLCNKTIGFEAVEDAYKNNFPILFLTPHVGNFEIILKRTAYLLNKNVTVLYKPDKNPWWNQLMINGRTEDNIIPVPTDKKGVLAIFKALKNREIVGILPDSIASQGDGVWVDFFANRVFATTLAAKLSLIPDVKTFIVACYRNADGFEANYIPFSATNHDIANTVQDIYTVIEGIVRTNPEQFYWSYDRFRVPDHAPCDPKMNTNMDNEV